VTGAIAVTVAIGDRPVATEHPTEIGGLAVIVRQATVPVVIVRAAIVPTAVVAPGRIAIGVPVHPAGPVADPRRIGASAPNGRPARSVPLARPAPNCPASRSRSDCAPAALT
jgi:hypothetical protein